MVTEQFSSYKYKAEVRSLCITAIAFAGGFAPYTNYPPTKMYLTAMSGFRVLFPFSPRKENSLWMFIYDQYPSGRDRFNFSLAILKFSGDL